MAKQNVFGQWYNLVQQKYSGVPRYLFIGCCLGLAGVVAFFSLHQYRSRQEQIAQRVFSEAAMEFEKAVSGSEESWVTLELIAGIGYEKHKNSVLAPYFLALQAEVLIHRGSIDQAVVVMKKMVDMLSPSSPLFFLYKTKYALMKIDATEDSLVREGIDELKKLAEDNNNIYQDEARFYVGAYQLAEDDRVSAVATWQSLVDDFGIYTGQSASPWAQRAREQLLFVS